MGWQRVLTQRGVDHDRHALGEVADHLEGEAARADDDRGAELRHRRARRAERLARLLAAAQVPRQLRLPLAEAAEVEDLAHAGADRGVAEVPGRAAVALLEAPLAGRQRVDEVVRGVHAGERAVERGGVQRVAGDDLHAGPGAPGQPRGIAGHAAHAMTFGEQPGHEPPADVAGGAGHEHVHRRQCGTGAAPGPAPLHGSLTGTWDGRGGRAGASGKECPVMAGRNPTRSPGRLSGRPGPRGYGVSC